MLKDSESENGMRTAGCVVHIVCRHYFVLKASKEVFKCILSVHAFKDVHIFNRNFVGQRIQFQFQPWHALQVKFTVHFLRRRVKQIVNLLIVELDVLDVN